jgi:DNA-binding CsgD family transcriptional regulator
LGAGPQRDASALQASIGHACRHPCLAGVLTLGEGAHAVQLRIVPLSETLGFESVRGRLAMLMASERNADPDPLDIRERLGLTRAEAELVALLCRGLRVDDCAAARGVSVATARAQLASAFAKTGTTSQARLVSHVLALAGQPRPRSRCCDETLATRKAMSS